MKNLQTLFLFLAVIALFILGFDWFSTGEAPLPNGGSLTVDLGFYGPVDEWLKFLQPFAIVVIVISIAGFFYTYYQIRNS